MQEICTCLQCLLCLFILQDAFVHWEAILDQREEATAAAFRQMLSSIGWVHLRLAAPICCLIASCFMNSGEQKSVSFLDHSSYSHWFWHGQGFLYILKTICVSVHWTPAICTALERTGERRYRASSVSGTFAGPLVWIYLFLKVRTAVC